MAQNTTPNSPEDPTYRPAPMDTWEDLDDDAQADYMELFEAIGLDDLVNNYEEIKTSLTEANDLRDFDSATLGTFTSLKSSATVFYWAKQYFPEITILMGLYEDLAKKSKVEDPDKTEIEKLLEQPGFSFEEYMGRFGNKFTWAGNFIGSQQLISEWFKKNLVRPDNPPAGIAPWEMRIGACNLIVPPINVQVNQAFRTGSLTGGVLRQRNTPKFNSGHSETTISLTLYFPTHESIWGFDGDYARINFDDPDTSDMEIDRFMSSLRGLIAQFKYSPILPIRSAYLNSAHDITAVALQSMTVSTVEGFPFCVAVNLNLLKFNHKVYLPMINDFHQAVHWGRFRQYMGRAAQKMQADIGQGFTESKEPENEEADERFKKAFPDIFDVPSDGGIEYQWNKVAKFNKYKDWKDGRDFRVYYPVNTPAKIYAPDTYGWRQYGEDDVYDEDRSGWEQFLEYVGVDVNYNPEAIYDYLKDWDQNNSQLIPSGISERDLIMDFFSGNVAAEEMTQDKLDEYIDNRLTQREAEAVAMGREYDSVQRDADSVEIRSWWFRIMFGRHLYSPVFQRYMDMKQQQDGQYRINEWEVPMEPIDFDPKNVIINGVAVSMSNNFARLQVQMQDEPVHQHIGGGDTQVSISLTVVGEADLIRLRKMFSHTQSLARLEHSHAVLGFLGLKNVLTSLCGVKYVLPMEFDTDTVEGFPHVYRVSLVFTDFDVFQQKREEISSEQQAELVAAFGKRNPFLRVKQLWGAFNAYPDFPLSIRNDKDKIIGQLDPDFYFRSFQTIDDDLVNWSLSGRASAKTNEWLAQNHADLEENKTNSNTKVGRENNDNSADKTEPSESDSKNWKDILNPFGSNSPEENAADVPQYGYSVSGGPSLNAIFNPFKHEINHYLMPSDETGGELTGFKLEAGEFTLGKWNIATGEWIPQTSPAILHDETPEQTLTTPRGTKKTTVSAPPKPDSQAAKGERWTSGTSSPDAKVDLEGEVKEDKKFPDIPTFSSFAEQGGSLITADGVSPGDPAAQFEAMMLDSQYRDVSGRMVRAFPTYMLWLIDEGGTFAGVKLFDNFYGLQSVIDFSIHQSEDVLGDTLILRISNLYRKLTTPFREHLGTEDGEFDAIDLIDLAWIRQSNLESGTTDMIRKIESIRLKPGVRVHLRMGYSANPNSLHTVFNGTITTVEYGDIVEVTAQSDAIELSPYINTTNAKGHSGKIDGAFNTGLWMSEPRDLMVRLLSMGSSTFRENLAHALAGQIFSENRFGIRHFGNIMYEPMSDHEADAHNARYNAIKASQDSQIKDVDLGESGKGLGDVFSNVKTGGFDAMLGETSTRTSTIPIIQSMWTNFFRNRDYELFKRNIYPGNGSGIAQFLGGDFPEAGLVIAQAAGVDTPIQTRAGVNLNPVIREDSREANLAEPRSIKLYGQTFEAGTDPSTAAPVTEAEAQAQADVLAKEQEEADNAGTDVSTGAVDGAGETVSAAANIARGNVPSPNDLGALVGTGWDIFSAFLEGKQTSPVLSALGITSPTGDDDIPGMDEVSFRAQTYMKSVWDLFQLCAALLPNYIVAVRPFEDRSTVFYGKPHWLYTSGVIPLSTGVGKTENDWNLEPDAELTKLLRDLAEVANPLADAEEQMSFRKDLDTITPYSTPAGLPADTGTAGEVAGLSLDSADGKATIPIRTGKVGIGKHLPVAATTNEDNKKHKKDKLEAKWDHPFFMDRKNSSPAPVNNPSRGEKWLDNPQGTETKNNDSAASRGENRTGSATKSTADPVPGKMGLFNASNFSPDDEKYYIAMRWPYKDWKEEVNGQPLYKDGHKMQDYKGKLVSVQNGRTGKICICSIGDEGPPVNSGIDIRLSPDAWVALGCKDGDEVTVGFAPEGTKRGLIEGSGSGTPDSGTASQQARGEKWSGNPSPTSTAGKDVGTVPKNTDPTQPATNLGGTTGELYVPSAADPAKPARTQAWDDYTSDESLALFNDGWKQPSKGQLTSAMDYEIWEGGDRDKPWELDPVGHFARRLFDREYNRIWAESKGDEVYFQNEAGSEEFQLNFEQEFPDLGEMGNQALVQYNPTDAEIKSFLGLETTATLTDAQKESVAILVLANDLWNQFRDRWKAEGDNQASKLYEAAVKVYRNLETTDGPEGTPIPKWAHAWNAYWPVDDEGGVGNYDSLTKRVTAEVLAEMGQTSGSEVLKDLIHGFKQFMWQHPYARAWLVVTTNSVIDSTAISDVGVPMTNFDVSLDWDPPGTEDGKGWDFPSSKVVEAWAYFLTYAWENIPEWKKILEVAGKVSPVSGKMVTADDLYEDHPASKMLAWMRENNEPGQKSSELMDRWKEQIAGIYNDTIGRLLAIAGNTLQGLIAGFRLQLMQLGLGLDMVGGMQRQANVLNMAFNDSIYYSEGAPGSLPRRADNPFTREYGEPVVEVREPFQRMHYISSFQHILHNGIQENINDVATVITASSDGKYPVTVYFDRGIPSERQVEKAVETGLFWDNARGAGFFSFLHPLLNPVESARAFIKTASGSSDELSSKRVGLWHLKENLKDIYGGEILILGDASIRPHDLVYLADVYERMYGMFEVEAVTHHFTPELGFITSLTPNALVTVNDPARWSMLSWASSLWANKNVREDVRRMFGVFSDLLAPATNSSSLVVRDLAEALEAPLLGHTQFTQGASALVKDITSAQATGLMMGSAQRQKWVEDHYVSDAMPALGNDVTLDGLAKATGDATANFLPGFNLMYDWAWDAWDWVRDNLLDQHGCYIQYLTKDGQPMDAGLSYAQGVAVGMHHSIDLLPGILGVKVNTKEDGHQRIAMQDLLGALGWSEIDVYNQYKYTSWWVSKTNAEILTAAGASTDPLPLVPGNANLEVQMVEIINVIDGDTMEVRNLETGTEFTCRFGGVDTPELKHKGLGTSFNDPSDPGYIAYLYTRTRLYDELIGRYGRAVVALRPAREFKDDYDRQLVVIFHNVPEGTPDENREAVLERQAKEWPLISWDSYMDDGRPYTFNWELVMAGQSQVDMYTVGRWDTYRGITGVDD